MKKTANFLRRTIKIMGIALIGINLLRIFDKLTYLKFMQNPLPALFNSIILVLFSYLPSLLKRIKIEMSDLLYTITSLSMILSLALGMIFNFYTHISGYDSLIHFMNGGLLVYVGLAVLSIFTKNYQLKNISPFLLIFFAFNFAMMIGAVWEIFEFTADAFGANMQRYLDINNDLTPFVGRAALADTMKDFILNTSGGIIASIILYFDIKKDSKYLEKIYVTKLDDNELFTSA